MNNHLDPEEIIRALRDGVEYRMPVKIRGLTVSMRPLTIVEENQVTSHVKTSLSTVPEDQRTPMFESTVRGKMTIQLATSSGPNARDSVFSDAVLNQMTNDEVVSVLQEYRAVCDKVNPSIEGSLGEEQMRELVGILKKSPGETDIRSALTQFSFRQLVDVVCHLLKTSSDSQADR